MGVSAEGAPSGDGGEWSIEDAERLLNSLTGVLSARMVGRPGGEIDEIHLLTTREVSAKRTVRNVESALLAQLGLSIDHRKISVARTSAPPQNADGEDEEDHVAAFIQRANSDRRNERLLFVGHEIETDRPHRIRARVTIEWEGERYVGEATGTDLPRGRLEVLAHGVLRAIEELVEPETHGERDADREFALALDGVRLLDAFDRRYVLVGVHALHGRDVTVLAGSAPADDAVEKSVIMAALQATDRWVRGRI